MTADHGPALPLARLARICALFSSPESHERAAAAAAADRLVRAAGLEWRDVIAPGAPTSRWIEPRDHREAAAAVLRYGVATTSWEIRFARTVARQSRASPRQAEILRDLVDAARRRAVEIGDAP